LILQYGGKKELKRKLKKMEKKEEKERLLVDLISKIP
jgi:hypothetical protein